MTESERDHDRYARLIHKLGFTPVTGPKGTWAVSVQTLHPSGKEFLIAIEPSDAAVLVDELEMSTDRYEWEDSFLGIVSEAKLIAERTSERVVHYRF
jgi:hypothetical protein